MKKNHRGYQQNTAGLKEGGNITRRNSGKYVPVIDKSRCEGCGDCVSVCPNGVLEMHILSGEEKLDVPFFIRLKISAHSNTQVRVVKPDACKRCSHCVIRCRKHAITLKRNTGEEKNPAF